MAYFTLILALHTLLLSALDAVAEPLNREYTGMCDASAAIALSDSLFAVADDEGNVIRVYSIAAPGAPVAIGPLFPLTDSEISKPKKKGKKKSKASEESLERGPMVMHSGSSETLTSDQLLKATKKLPEIDLEAATEIQSIVFWVGSHGRNASGEEDLNRRQIYFSKITMGPKSSSATPVIPSLEPMRQPYARLLEDFIATPTLKHLQLDQASKLAPKELGGLNIEAFSATSTTRALIGLRSPLYNDKAIVIPIENPLAMVEGKSPKVLPPMYLDLAARGIKDIVTVQSTAYIVAGSPDSSGRGALFEWKDTRKSTEVLLLLNLETTGINAEAILPLMGGKRLLLLSDDGNETIEGKPCKKLKDPSKRKFRTVEIDLTR